MDVFPINDGVSPVTPRQERLVHLPSSSLRRTVPGLGRTSIRIRISLRGSPSVGERSSHFSFTVLPVPCQYLLAVLCGETYPSRLGGTNQRFDGRRAPSCFPYQPTNSEERIQRARWKSAVYHWGGAVRLGAQIRLWNEPGLHIACRTFLPRG